MLSTDLASVDDLRARPCTSRPASGTAPRRSGGQQSPLLFPQAAPSKPRPSNHARTLPHARQCNRAPRLPRIARGHIVDEQWCVVVLQVAPSILHQQSASAVHQPGSPETASTQTCGVTVAADVAAAGLAAGDAVACPSCTSCCRVSGAVALTSELGERAAAREVAHATDLVGRQLGEPQVLVGARP